VKKAWLKTKKISAVRSDKASGEVLLDVEGTGATAVGNVTIIPAPVK
jgi:hypothetical protein